MNVNELKAAKEYLEREDLVGTFPKEIEEYVIKAFVDGRKAGYTQGEEVANAAIETLQKHQEQKIREMNKDIHNLEDSVSRNATVGAAYILETMDLRRMVEQQKKDIEQLQNDKNGLLDYVNELKKKLGEL